MVHTVIKDSQHTSQSSDYRYFHANLAVDGKTDTHFNKETCTHTNDSNGKDAYWMINLESISGTTPWCIMMRVLVLCFIPLMLGTYFASETVMTQGCDEPCSNMNCSTPYYGTCCHKKNIAWESNHTNQSSEFMEFNQYFPSNLSVDGNTNTDFNSFTCTHTDPNSKNSPYWMINLESTHNISEINLYLRSNNAERNNGLKVKVNSIQCFSLNKTLSKGNTSVEDQIQHIHCSPPLTGSLVSVTVDNPYHILTLCEVQIFVCDPGWYGEECDRQCNCRDSTDCDKMTGWCRDGCRAGKQGDGCQCDCQNETYGLDCNEGCGHCLNDTVCDKTNGTCHSGCVQGYKAPLCQECDDGKFGINCLSTCGKCLGNQSCNKTDGTCQNSCEEHYIPPMCTDCVPGRYGTDCQSICGQCEGNDTCGRDGTCPPGCLPGFTDGFCQTYVSTGPSNIAPIAGGVAAVIFIMIIIVVVIVILKRRRLQRKPTTTMANGDENPKETSFINISEPKVTKQSKQKNITKHDAKVSSKSQETKNKPKEWLSTTRPEQKTKKSATILAANQEVEEIAAVEGKPEVCPTEPTGGGNEYYSVIPAPITLPNLTQYIKDRITGVGFDNEFKLLPYGIHDDHDEGKKPENKKRNRFLELYPYDHSRVVLKPELDADLDYINASYINGYRSTKTFIAAQGPNPVTVDDFWRMIWQQRVTMIVMVTRLTELTKRKCEQYWPDNEEMREFSNIKVHHEYSTVRRDCTIRIFKVKHSEHASESREVTQLHFTSWPDHDVPSAPALVSFWKHFRRLHQEQDTGPVVVHCSAGVGRTGTFIALDWLFDEAEREEKVNVFNCVNQMRKARMNMVQTVSQYGFLHEVVLEAVQSRNTFYTSAEFDQKFGTGESFTADQEREIQRQFEKLNTMRKTFTDKQVSDAKLPENIGKNRDQNILPENKSKPYLMTPVKGRTQYINAVVLPSHVRHSAIIATQTPLPDTVVDFWRLVYDHDIFNIICLEGYEGLYPSEDTVESGPFNICLDQRRSISSQTQITLSKLEQPDESRQINVYRPSCERPSDLLEFVNEMETRGVFRQDKLLVHCINGSDLCGLFCGVLNIITRLRLDREVDIFLDIRKLQTIRPSFIHSLGQYKFCFDAVKEYERTTSIYANV